MQTPMLDDFRTTFQHRLACLRALVELSERQSGLIEADDYAELLPLLRNKQDLLDHLHGWAADHSGLWQAWPNSRAELPSAGRDDCEQLLSEAETLTARLIAAEESGFQLLTSRRDATQRALQALACGVQADNAYRAPRSGGARIDLNT